MCIPPAWFAGEACGDVFVASGAQSLVEFRSVEVESVDDHMVVNTFYLDIV